MVDVLVLSFIENTQGIAHSATSQKLQHIILLKSTALIKVCIDNN